jgi:hypothetical protein
MNGNGLTKAVTNEIVMLTKIADAGGRKRNSPMSELVDPERLMPRFESHLPESQVLTGVSQSPFTKG